MNRKDKKGRVLKTGESQRKDGTYQYRYKDIFGKYKYLYAPTLAELRASQNKNIQTQSLSPADAVTVGEICQNWLTIMQGLVKETTHASYYWCCHTYIIPKIGDTKVSQMTHNLFLAFFKDMVYTQALTVSTLNKTYNILNAAFNMAVMNNQIKANIMPTIKPYLKRIVPNTPEIIEDFRPQNRLTEPQIQNLLTYLNRSDNKMQYNRIAVLLYTGLRISELCGLLWSDIDFQNNKIYVRHNLVYHRTPTGCQHVMQTPKSKKSIRVVPMLPKVKDILTCIYVEKETQVNFGQYKDLVFYTTQHKPLKSQTMADNLKHIIARYNAEQSNQTLLIQHCTPHTLRHTFCSILYENGVDVKLIQDIMGHTSSTVTLDFYTQISEERQQEELKKIPYFT